jgi:hypothetical protein
MNIITLITIILNIVAILVLCAGLFHKFENPKNKAVYGYVIAGGMIPYMLALSIYVISDIIVNRNFWSIFLILCVISPFIIGKLVKYETLKIYTLIQILCFCASLAVLCLK